MSNKVLIFSLSYFPLVGGAEIAVKEITDRLTDIQFDMVTLSFNPSEPKVERLGNVNVHRLNTSKKLFPLKAFMFARGLHKKNKYDAIWSIMAAYAGFAAMFFKYYFPKVKYILTLQEGDPIEYIKRKVRFVYPLFKKIFLSADVIQTISNYLADFARDMGYKGKVEVIPNGVDFKKFAEPTFLAHGQEGNSLEKSVRLITTSRLVAKNGVGDIIESLEYLPTNVSLEIIGTGPLGQELKIKVKENKLESRARFIGFVDQKNIPKYLHESDIFIRPSLSEGMGNSFIEAMAAGLPVIATPVGGIVDFLKDAETGLFCEVNNPESIAKQVKRLIEDKNLRDKLVKNAKSMVEEKYDWNLISSQMKSKVFSIL